MSSKKRHAHRHSCRRLGLSSDGRGGADSSLVENARAARLSRRTIYLHFADRADLMTALIRHVDELG
jgi:hypothetical protein